jgi:hypothetical protein
MLSTKEKIVCESAGVRTDRCFERGCYAPLTRDNESSGLGEVTADVVIAVPLCRPCASARDHRAGLSGHG